MPYYVPVDKGPDDRPLEAFTPSSGASFRAAVSSTWNENPATLLYDYGGLQLANRGQRLTREQAQERVRAEGLSFDIPESGYTDEALGILIRRQHDNNARRLVDERTPWGFGSLLRGSAQLMAGVVDPLNVASAFVPVVGEARAASWLARAGDSVAARVGTRAAIGGVEGAAGAAMLEPLVYGLHAGLEDDYTMRDSLVNLAFGAVLGGTLHAGARLPSDVREVRMLRDVRELERQMAEVQTAADRIAEAGPAAHEAAFRSAVADAVQGRAPDVEAVVRTIGQQEREANFKAWFGDSKVVDAEGRPLVVYHGTRGDFSAFSPEKVKGRFPNSEGFYFASSSRQASVYADSVKNAAEGFNPASRFIQPAAEGGNVMPAFVSLRNPKIITVSGTLESAVDSDGGAQVRAAREAGHDGVIVERKAGDEWDGKLVIAFRPEQIKSAIGNSGRFDPNSASLTDPLDDVRAAVQRQADPDSLAIGSPDSSRAAAARLEAAPKDESVESASTLLTDATEQLDAIKRNLELAGYPPERLKAIDEAMKAYDQGIKDARGMTQALEQYALCGLRQ